MASSDPLPRPAAAALRRGVVLPAMPLALTAERRMDERRQRALCRYYLAAGAGGLAVGVHTTQFAIREYGLFRPVLALAADEMARPKAAGKTSVRIAGVCGDTAQAVAEAALARDLGYHAALLSLAALRDADDGRLLAHCGAVAEVLPLVGFYLQPAVGGRVLSFAFWRRFAEIERVVAIKIAPFNRYQTLDVVRAVAESGRDDIALYTGNDDNIVADLLTPFRFRVGGRLVERRIVGGLLGQWAVWTSKAVELLAECHAAVTAGVVPAELLCRGAELTDANAAIFDAAHGFAGCIAGIHEVLRRQGLLEGTWCLDPRETLSPGQAEEIERVCHAYPHLCDDEFVAKHRDGWDDTCRSAVRESGDEVGMETVHVFISTGRFRSFAEMRAFIDQTYTEDGDGLPSAFMREVGLSGYEPGCIEAHHRERPVPLAELLAGASYSPQWLPDLDESRLADAAICVFAPNRVCHPKGSSLEYLGGLQYHP